MIKCYLLQFSLFFSTVALCKLLLHAIQANDTRLQEIMIQGEEVEQPTSGIRTRSKTANRK